MFTDKEQKLIKRRAFLSALCPSCIFAALAGILVWGVLIIVASFAGLDVKVFGFWIALLVTILCALLLVSVISAIMTSRIYKSDEWCDIVAKADGQNEGDGREIQWTVLSVTALVSGAAGRYRNDIEKVEKKSGLKLPGIRTVSIWSCIVITGVCVLFAIPIMVKGRSDLHDIQDDVAASVEALQDASDKYGMRLSYLGLAQDYRTGKIDPRKIKYSNTGYRVTCYPDYDNDKCTFVVVTISNDGDIDDVEYYCTLFAGTTNEEEYANAEKKLERMHELLIESKLDFVTPDLEKVYLPTEGFKKRFMETDLNDGETNLHVDYGAAITYRLSHRSDGFILCVDIRKPSCISL